MTATITADGLLALPPELREQLGLVPGQSLEVHADRGLLIVWKKSESDSFDKWRGLGRLPSGTRSDDYLNHIRDGDRG